jgi:RNA polymerase sigma factor (sigma-70 family)
LDLNSDSEILNQCRKQETASYGFNLLVRKYQQQVYWIIRRMVLNHDDADDLVQDTFLKVWKNIDSFREDSSLYTWIYRIATNEVLTFLNKKKRMFFVPLSDNQKELSGMLENENNFTGSEIQLKFQKALLTLPEKQRLVFQMRYYDEMEYKTISVIVGTSVGALKASYHIAMKKIEDYLINH